MNKRLCLLAFSFLLNACAHPTANIPNINTYDIDEIRRNQVRTAWRIDEEREVRIQSVFYRLKKSTGTELCDKKLKPEIGLSYMKIDRYKKPWFNTKSSKIAETENQDLKYVFKQPEETIWIRYVIKDSVADKAGIKKKDKLVSLYGVPAPTGPEAFEKLEKLIEKSSKDGLPVEIEVERNGKVLAFTLQPDMVCPYTLGIDETIDSINAYANGDQIFLSEEIIDYLKDDNDLASILSHELAHNTLGHINSTGINIATGSVIDVITYVFTGVNSNAGDIGAQMYSIEFEKEADYVGMYYMARAGYDYKKVKDVEGKLAARNYASLYLDPTTHPTPQVRYALARETTAEIDLKKAFGEELLPNFSETNSWLKNKRD